MEEAYVHSLESFGSVDGPGVRYVIFMQGCHMRCQFCHNPDTWKEGGGTEYTSEELLKKALRYRGYWGKEGGITVSGGEPLLQLDFMLEFFRKAKEQGVHTVIDTAGEPFTREDPFFGKFCKLMEVTDLLLLDIKEINPKRHQILTGQKNDNILELAKFLSEIHKPVWIRHVLVPERSDYEEDLRNLHEFLETLENIQRVEVIPYHTMGIYKWENLGLSYPLDGINPPTKERVKLAEKILNVNP
ncbi:pyruvate formate-lyase-activating enzyme [Mediterraneibacter butyricigenes]|uniref:Pyruvate formate-lyase-activating enzyme n=1 Tax=Mediterraneibacter butyricigenes TaxID=2316025 RepID=A0A391PB67_9FIRM|nr:pyruvate formate-lyase-activating protein [Mediterraneibacter butyricigenes]GCA68278.1 pyruvate formate-lyase-activating enzyme [Mediterraneibacter butyricigenes]